MKDVELPWALLPGMGIVADEDCEPIDVQYSFYNERLEFVAQLEDCSYSDEDLAAVAAQNQEEQESLFMSCWLRALDNQASLNAQAT